MTNSGSEPVSLIHIWARQCCGPSTIVLSDFGPVVMICLRRHRSDCQIRCCSAAPPAVVKSYRIRYPKATQKLHKSYTKATHQKEHERGMIFFFFLNVKLSLGRFFRNFRFSTLQ